MRKILWGLGVIFLAITTLAASYQNGKIVSEPVEPDAYRGQKRYYVTPAGTGDCSSWTSPCTFRTALTKLSTTLMDVIYVGAGAHDLNNGSDGTGTSVSDNYLQIIGMGNHMGIGSKLVNSHASASKILTLSGNSIVVENILFNNSAQADKNVIFLTLSGVDQAVIDKNYFVNAPGDGGGTGLKIESSCLNLTVSMNWFTNCIDYGIHINGLYGAEFKDNKFFKGGTGIYMQGTSDSGILFEHLDLMGFTTAINIAALSAVSNRFKDTYFCKNTTNITDVSAYDTIRWINVDGGNVVNATYPATDGVALDTGDGVWVWSAMQDIIPEDTITTPFKIVGINVQDWSAAQIYKINLFVGDTTPTESLGIFEIRLGDPADKKAHVININLEKALPSNATVGAKVMSSTAGVDSVTVTLNYEAF